MNNKIEGHIKVETHITMADGTEYALCEYLPSDAGVDAQALTAEHIVKMIHTINQQPEELDTLIASYKGELKQLGVVGLDDA